MVVSSYAMLCFGFTVGTYDDPPEWLMIDGDHIDFECFICKVAGLSDNHDYETYKLAINDCPAELHMYCSYDYPMLILSPKGCEFRVSIDYTKEISEQSLKVDQYKIDAFKAWCEKNNIEYKEPKWLLCSMTG